MKILIKFRFYFLFFVLVPLKGVLSYDGFLNNNMALYGNSTFKSAGVSISCLPFVGSCNKNTPMAVFTDLYFTFNFQLLWLLQTSYCARVLRFFPYLGIELFYTSLKFFIFRSIKDYVLKMVERGKPGSLNIVMSFEPECDLSFTRRCCQQIGIGLSLLYIERYRNNSSVDNEICEENALSLNDGYPFVDFCFVHKINFKFKCNSNTEAHVSFGYVYNPLLLNMFIDRSKPKDIKINEPGLFTFFVQFDFGGITDKGNETIGWFNNGEVVYKRLERVLRHSFSFVPLLVGKNYYCNPKSVETKFFSGFYYSISSPYLFSLSNVHYIGLYCDVSLSFPEVKLNSNFTSGLSFTSDYRSVIFEHNIGLYIFANGKMFGKRYISIVTIPNDKVDVRTIANHVVYRPRLYLNIHRFFVEWKRYKFWNLLKRIRLFIGLNIMLYTITNTKDIIKMQKANERHDYFPAQVESYIFGFSIE